MTRDAPVDAEFIDARPSDAPRRCACPCCEHYVVRRAACARCERVCLPALRALHAQMDAGATLTPPATGRGGLDPRVVVAGARAVAEAGSAALELYNAVTKERAPRRRAGRR